jgi:hypothetical protein
MTGGARTTTQCDKEALLEVLLHLRPFSDIVNGWAGESEEQRKTNRATLLGALRSRMTARHFEQKQHIVTQGDRATGGKNLPLENEQGQGRRSDEIHFVIACDPRPGHVSDPPRDPLSTNRVAEKLRLELSEGVYQPFPVDPDEASIAHIIGEIAAYADQPRTITVRALEPLDSLVITRHHLNELIRLYPEIGLFLVEVMAKRQVKITRQQADLYARVSAAVVTPATPAQKVIDALVEWLGNPLFPTILTAVCLVLVACAVSCRWQDFWDIGGFALSVLAVWIGSLVLNGQGRETKALRERLREISLLVGAMGSPAPKKTGP